MWRGWPCRSPCARNARPQKALVGRAQLGASRPPPLVRVRSLRPYLGQGASRRARVGRVRRLAFLSILRKYSSLWSGFRERFSQLRNGLGIETGSRQFIVRSRSDIRQVAISLKQAGPLDFADTDHLIQL